MAGLGLIGLNKLFSPKKNQVETKRTPMRVNLQTRAPAPAIAAEPSEAPTLYVYEREAEYGPFNLFQIQQMMTEGRVTSQALYWSEGMTEWRSIAELTDRVSSAR